MDATERDKSRRDLARLLKIPIGEISVFCVEHGQSAWVTIIMPFGVCSKFAQMFYNGEIHKFLVDLQIDKISFPEDVFDGSANTRQLIARACPQGYVETPALWELLEQLEHRGVCLVLGLPGHGKTTLALQAMGRLEASQHFKPLRLEKPEQISFILGKEEDDDSTETSRGYVVLLDDIFGKGNYNEAKKKAWEEDLKLLLAKVKTSQVKLIIVSRAHTYEAYETSLGEHSLLEHVCKIDMRKPEYWTNEDKRKILLKFCRQYKVQLATSPDETVGKLELCTEIGFPQCCNFFVTNAKAQHEELMFFQQPVRFLIDQLKLLQEKDVRSFFVLVLTWQEGGILRTENLSTADDESPQKLRDLSQQFGLKNAMTSLEIEATARNLCDVFLCEEEKRVFMFSHQSVHDCLVVAVCEADLKRALHICSVQQLCEYVNTEGSTRGHPGLTYTVRRSQWPLLAARLVKALTSEDQDEVLAHPSLQNLEFMTELSTKHLQPCHISQLLRRKCTTCIKMPDLSHTDMVSSRCLHIKMLHFDSEDINISTLAAALIVHGIQELPYHILTSREMAQLPDTDRSTLLEEALVCACHVSDASRVSLLLIRQAPVTANALRAACATEEENSFILKSVNQRLPHTELKPELCSELLLLCCERDRPRYLEYLLTDARLQHYQGELNRVITLVLWKYFPGTGIKSPQIVSQFLSALKSAGAIFDKKLFNELIVASRPDSFTPKQSLSHGMDVEQLHSRDQDTRLSVSASSNLECLDVLMEAALTGIVDIDAVDRERRSLLLRAVEANHVTMAEFLLQRGANPDGNVHLPKNRDVSHSRESSESCDTAQVMPRGSHLGRFGPTPLHVAAGHRYLSLIEVLVRYNARTDVLNYEQRTPLHVYADSEDKYPWIDREQTYTSMRKRVANVLTERCNINKQDANGSTPLHLAARRGHLSLIEALLSHKARTDVVDGQRRTALHVFADSYALIGDSEAGRRVMELLVESTSDINLQDEHGATPLHLAARKDRLSLTEALLSHKARTDVVDDLQRTALHVFADSYDHVTDSKDRKQVMELLVESTSDINLQDKHGATPLHLAVRRGDLSLIEALLSHKARTDVVDDQRSTALHVFADSCTLIGDSEAGRRVMELLVESTSDINLQDEHGATPLHLAARNDYLSLIEALLSHKARTDLVDDQHSTALHVFADSYDHIADKKDRKQVMELLVESTSDINLQDEHGATPLHLAARRGHAPLVEVFLSHKARTDLVDDQRRTALHALAASGKYLVDRKDTQRVLDLLVNRTTDINEQDNELKTALHIAAENNNLTMLNVLINHEARFDLVDRHNNSVLHSYVRQNPRFMCSDVEEAIMTKVPDINSSDSKGDTPLHLAVGYRNISVMENLMKHGARMDIVNKEGDTPLDLWISSFKQQHTQSERDAKLRQRVEEQMVRKPSVGGKTDINTQDNEGRTLLHIAASGGAMSLIETLMKHGAKVDMLNKHGQTPLHVYAALRNQQHLRSRRDKELRRRVEKLMVEKLSIEGKIDINTQDNEGRTPLHVAASSGAMSLIEILIKHGARVDMLDEHGQTPLHVYAALRDQQCLGSTGEKDLGSRVEKVMVEKMPVEGKIDINTQDIEGRTPFHLAASSSQLTLMETLMEHGARTDVLDKRGQTMLHVYAASRERHPGTEIPLSTDSSSWTLSSSETEKMAKQRQGAEKLVVEKTTGEMKVDINTQDMEGRTPLHLAVSSGSQILIETLIGHGTKVDKLDKRVLTSMRETAGSQEEQHLETEIYLDWFPDSELLLSLDTTGDRDLRQRVEASMIKKMSAGCEIDLNKQDKNKRTPLHLAAKRGDLRIMELLLRRHVRTDLVDKEGLFALHWYALWHPDRLNSAQSRLLHLDPRSGIHRIGIAMSRERVEAMLVDSTPDVWVRAPCGCTALDMARRSGNSSLVRALEARAPTIMQKTDSTRELRECESCFERRPQLDTC